MPSLNALGEFRASFNGIANEREDVISRNLPFDNFALPTTEAEPFEPPARDAPPAPSAPSAEDDSPEPAVDNAGGGFDFSAFLNTLPTVNPPPVDDLLGDINPPGGEPPGIDHLFEDSSPPASSEAPLSDEELMADDDFFKTDETPPLDDSIPSDDFQVTPPDETPQTAEDDFSIPDDLLSGLSDEIESAPSDFPKEEPPSEEAPSEDFPFGDLETSASGSDDFGDENFEGLDSEDTGGLPDFDFPTEEPAAETPDDERIKNAYDLGGERQDGSLSADGVSQDSASPDSVPQDSAPPDNAFDDSFFSEDMPVSEDTPLSKGVDADLDLDEGSIDLGGETLDTPAEDTDSNLDMDSFLSDDAFSGFPSADSSTQDDLGLDGLLSDTDLPDTGSSAQDDSGFDSSLPDIDFPGFDSSDTQESAGGDLGEPPGLGDLGGEFESDSIDLEVEPETHARDDSAGDDFVLPILDDIIDSSKIAPVAPPPKKGLFGRRKKEDQEEPGSDDVEEIRLEQEDLDKLLETLYGYPLNLRVACEELIAEQVLEPQQLSKLIRLLINGANVKEMAEYAGSLLKKTIVIPKSFQKGTGAEWEAEKSSFAYIFVHNFLPVLRLFAVIAALIASIIYLGYRFLYIPYKAETIYKRGYERIFAGEYQRANELFHEAFVTHRKKNWFYEYAKGFRDQRRYLLAEAKYDELLRYYPRDKKGVLEYANLETNYIMNYDKANRILQEQLLDYAPDDYDGLLAAGDNFFAWADSDPSRYYDRYEDARFSYARLLEKFGWTSPIVERMMKYFIRTDDLKEVLNLRSWFEARRDRMLSPASTAELGGYLLDKQLEKVSGVPNPYVESIESVRAMLLQAVRGDPLLPEAHYHLARYYNNLGNVYEERLTLENAIRAFDLADNESVRRRLYNVDARYRYAELLINNGEMFPADERLVEGINLYEDYVSRNLITPSPQLGQLYALRGDLEYFVKTGDMQAALRNYRVAERYGWSPPEIQYRMGSAYYQLEDWGNALDYLFKASAELPLNRRLLYALGNTTYKRGDYFAAQGYYNRLIDILENQRVRLPSTMPNDRPEFLELGERLMMARNNAGVVYEALADQTGNRDYRSRALSLYAESARAWDSITRNPVSMARMTIPDAPSAPGVNLGFLNANNALRPVPDYSPEVFIRIDKDVLEPSRWEELAPYGGLIN